MKKVIDSNHLHKREYTAPVILVMEYSAGELLTISGGSKGIGYGGVDTNGTLDPASRKAKWDDDDWEE